MGEEKISFAESLESYVQNTRKVCALSNVRVADLEDSHSYAKTLRENFNQIRPIAAQNRGILSEILEPVLSSKELLTEEQVEALADFERELQKEYMIGTLDTQIVMRTAERLYEDACRKEDVPYMLRQIDMLLESYCAFINYTSTVTGGGSIAKACMKKAEELMKQIERMMQEENFAKLEDMQSREILLTNYRYMPMLYEAFLDSESNARMLSQYKNALEIPEKPFFQREMQGYPWDFYEIMTLGAVASTGACNNVRGYSKEQLQFVSECSEQSYRNWSGSPEFQEMIPENSIRLYLLSNRYLTGQLEEGEYKKELLEMYTSRNEQAFNLHNFYENMPVPMEYLSIVEAEKMKEKERRILLEFYRNLVFYGHSACNSGELPLLRQHYGGILKRFAEVSEELTLEQLCMESLAALHPPTYIHSHMVAKFSECLCRYLLQKRPELFHGVLGYLTVEEIKRHASDIQRHIYHGALVHDIGKIAILDTIFIYGRNITDEEFQIIRCHPETGYELAAEGTSLYPYREMIRYHHRSYDEKGGYPRKEDDVPLADKILVDIITIADCMDAATDTVGRSYAKGKTLEQFKEELFAGAGVRYSPDVAELFSDASVCEDIEYLLTEGREKMYSDTYEYLMKNVHQTERTRGNGKDAG